MSTFPRLVTSQVSLTTYYRLMRVGSGWTLVLASGSPSDEYIYITRFPVRERVEFIRNSDSPPGERPFIFFTINREACQMTYKGLGPRPRRRQAKSKHAKLAEPSQGSESLQSGNFQSQVSRPGTEPGIHTPSPRSGQKSDQTRQAQRAVGRRARQPSQFGRSRECHGAGGGTPAASTQ